MSRRARRKRTFDYAPIAERRKLGWQQRMAGFQGLVFKADRGNPDPLVDYCMSGDPRQLSGEDMASLGWLIENKLARKDRPLVEQKRNGRPLGSLTPKNAAIGYAGNLVRVGKKWWCKQHGRTRAPGPNKAPVDRLIKRAIELAEAEYPQARGKITADDVHAASQLEPDARLRECMPDYDPQVQREILEIALK
jgi:hypothetical protein